MNIQFFIEIWGKLSSYHWLLQIFAIVFLTSLVALGESIFYRRLYPKLKLSSTHWDDAFLRAIHKPLRLLIWFLGVFYAAQSIQSYLPNATIFAALQPLKQLGVIGITSWIFVRFINAFESNVMQGDSTNKGIDKTTISAIGKIVKVSVLVTAAIVTMQTMGYSISGVLTLGGIGGAALALSSKDLIANFFGATMIYMDKPFKVGDWIRSPDKNIEGTVEYIGWRLTRIRTFDKRPLYVPNALFTTLPIENPSRMHNRRIKTTIGLRYSDANLLEIVLKDIEAMLRKHDEVDPSQTLMVNFFQFGPSSLDFFIYCFTKTTNWVKFQSVQQDIFLKAIEIITKHGAECAFPTTTVEIPEQIIINNQEVNQ